MKTKNTYYAPYVSGEATAYLRPDPRQNLIAKSIPLDGLFLWWDHLGAWSEILKDPSRKWSDLLCEKELTPSKAWSELFVGPSSKFSKFIGRDRWGQSSKLPGFLENEGKRYRPISKSDGPEMIEFLKRPEVDTRVVLQELDKLTDMPRGLDHVYQERLGFKATWAPIDFMELMKYIIEEILEGRNLKKCPQCGLTEKVTVIKVGSFDQLMGYGFYTFIKCAADNTILSTEDWAGNKRRGKRGAKTGEELKAPKSKQIRGTCPFCKKDFSTAFKYPKQSYTCENEKCGKSMRLNPR